MMVDIDLLGNYYGNRGTQAGSFSVVIRRMAEHMEKLCSLYAWNIGGEMWREKTDMNPELRKALNRGNLTTKGRDYKHLGIIHGHPAYYSEADQKYFKGYHSEIERYKKKILMTVNESAPLPRAWISNAQMFNQIWVPSKYCQDVWKQQLPKADIRIVPHGVESFFRPSPNMVSTMENPTLMLVDKMDEFKFLNIYSASSFPHRKGIDVLLMAYMEEFVGPAGKDGGDDVCLIIKTENKPYLQELINKEAILHEAPPKIKIIDQGFSVMELVQLYNATDCVLSPHRGEAWGMDISNAIACGVPTICTDFSGPVDFARGYATMIPIEKDLVPGVCYSNTEGLYAEPKIDELKKSMREHFKDKSGGKTGKLRKKAIDKAPEFRKRWNWENSAQIAVKNAEEVK